MRVNSLATALEAWFAEVQRPMPWRRRPTPYACWLSEIMMQQTTYAAALPYYERFMRRFPTVRALAKADESDVLKEWEGLGYYARARNLLRAARKICERGWPATSAEWATLPGVGPYTAAALASVLRGERTPVVDGNVARVFARVWQLSDDFSRQTSRVRLAERLRPEIAKAKVPGNFNQAMMELGATVCTPANPECGACPLAAMCASRRDGSWMNYPVRLAKRPLPVVRTQAVIVKDGEGRILLVQNRKGGLLKGLWELPTVEPAGELAQTFSHFRLEQSTFGALRTDAEFRNPADVPLTTATRRALKSFLTSRDA